MSIIQDPITGKSWNTLRKLIDYIMSTHHGYIVETLHHLDRLIDRIARERLVPLELMDPLRREFTALADLLESHLARQEGRLFPRICEIREPAGDTGWALQLADHLPETLDRMARENTDTLALADRIISRLCDRNWQDRGPLVAEFAGGILELREDLAEHFHLETDLLFPHVRETLQGCGVPA